MTKEPFRLHFQELVKDYTAIHVVDLLQDKRDREERLTKEYYKQYFDSQFKRDNVLFFLHFDFHRFCKGDRFENTRVLIGQLSNSINNFGYF